MTVLISPYDWLGSVNFGTPPIYTGTEAQRNTPLLQVTHLRRHHPPNGTLICLAPKTNHA